MDILGIVSLDSSESLLGTAGEQPPRAVLPFGGKYRLIDFILSNMVHSGIAHVGVFMERPHPLLFEHLRSGRDWDLERKQEGLRVFPWSVALSGEHGGDVGGLRRQLEWIKRSRQNYVAFSGDSIVCPLDYGEVLRFHQDRAADITVVYAGQSWRGEMPDDFLRPVCDSDGRISAWDDTVSGTPDSSLATGVFLLDKELFVALLEGSDIAAEQDFIHHCLLPQMSRYRCYGFGVNHHVFPVYSLPSYYQANMALLEPMVRRDLFVPLRAVYTRTGDEPPAKYTTQSQVAHSLIAGGCRIEGVVENSVLFRGVQVSRDAVIRNSLVLPGTRIESGAVVDYAVCDSRTVVAAGQQLAGTWQNPLLVPCVT